MIDPKILKKISDVLNSEGTILGLYIDPKNNLYLGSFLKDGSGTIFYSVDINQFKNYLKSKLTLSDLYIKSSSFLVKHKFMKEIKTYLKQEFLESLQCGNDYYKDIPESMKSKEIERKYGRESSRVSRPLGRLSPLTTCDALALPPYVRTSYTAVRKTINYLI